MRVRRVVAGEGEQLRAIRLRALLDAVAGWAAARGAERLELSVTDRAPAAAALYRAAGFVPTGEERPLPGDPPRVERVLHRSLTIP